MIAPMHRDTLRATRAAPAPDQETRHRREAVTGRSVDMLLRGLGVVIPLGFGIVLLDLPLANPTFPLVLTATSVAAVGLLGGALIRLRRAALIVPAAFFVGLGIGHLLHGWFISNMTVGTLVIVVLYALLQWCLPLIVGTACGLPLGIWLEERFERIRGSHTTSVV